MDTTFLQDLNIIERARYTAAAGKVPKEQLSSLVSDIFTACGLSRTNAEIATEATIYAQLRGTDSHGVVGMPLYITGLIDGTIKHAPDVKTVREMPACAVMDADHGLGLVTSTWAMELAMEFASEYGVGAVAVRNSSHFGTAGYYAEMAVRRGMIGMAFSNAAPAIAPTGSSEQLFGTNPIGMGFPNPQGQPIIGDLATAMVARSKVRQILATGGKSIPSDWALDENGHTTTDPAAAIRGSMLPIGGPKGYALALAVEILCSGLSDGPPGFDITYEHMVKRPSDISHFFLALDLGGFSGIDVYGKRVAHIADKVRNARSIDPANPPRLPGARGQKAAERSESQGIDIQANLSKALLDVAGILQTAAEQARS